MLGVSIVLFVVLVAVLIAVAAVTAGFGDLMKPVFQDARPVGLPEAQVSPDDIDGLRFNVVLRGYKMADVDGVLLRLSREIAERDAVLAELRGHLPKPPRLVAPPAEAPPPVEVPAPYDPLTSADQPTTVFPVPVADPGPADDHPTTVFPAIGEDTADLPVVDPAESPTQED